jgi:hypothetical protein
LHGIQPGGIVGGALQLIDSETTGVCPVGHNACRGTKGLLPKGLQHGLVASRLGWRLYKKWTSIAKHYIALTSTNKGRNED